MHKHKQTSSRLFDSVRNCTSPEWLAVNRPWCKSWQECVDRVHVWKISIIGHTPGWFTLGLGGREKTKKGNCKLTFLALCRMDKLSGLRNGRGWWHELSYIGEDETGPTKRRRQRFENKLESYTGCEIVSFVVFMLSGPRPEKAKGVVTVWNDVSKVTKNVFSCQYKFLLTFLLISLFFGDIFSGADRGAICWSV